MTDEYKPGDDYRPSNELTDDELVARIVHRHTPTEIPPCRVCGGPLSIGRIGGGEPTRYGCATQEDDPDNPKKLRLKPGRAIGDDHYRRSEFEDRRHTDPAALELARRFEVLRQDADKQELAALREDRDQLELIKAARVRGRWYEVILKPDGRSDRKPWREINNRDMRVVREIVCPACVVELADTIKISDDKHTCTRGGQ